jgi:hypothetical protein
MKSAFFTFLAFALPAVLVGGLLYMFLEGLYRLFDDWRLGRELRELRTQADQHRRLEPRPLVLPTDPLAAFEDRPPPPESQGLATFPLDADFRPAVMRSRGAATPTAFMEPESSAESEIVDEPPEAAVVRGSPTPHQPRPQASPTPTTEALDSTQVSDPAPTRTASLLPPPQDEGTSQRPEDLPSLGGVGDPRTSGAVKPESNTTPEVVDEPVDVAEPPADHESVAQADSASEATDIDAEDWSQRTVD